MYSLVNVFRLPLTQEWLYAFSYIPISLVVPPSLYLVHHQMNLIYQFWLHTEIIDKVGPLEWILNTPSHHRVHHGSNKYCLDKNFGGWLIIWDRMFGTFQEEIPDVPIVYGLVDQVKSFNPFYLQVFYYKKLHEKWQAMDGWKNKIYSLIKGPGWRPGSPWTGFIEEVPDVTSRKKHVYSEQPLILTAYLFSQFLLAIINFQAINFCSEILSPFTLYLHLVFVVLSFSTIGMLFDANPWAPLVEFCRCTLVFVHSRERMPILSNSLNYLGLVDVFGLSVEPVLRDLLRSFFGVSMVVWAVICSHKLYQRAVNAVCSCRIFSKKSVFNMIID